MMNNNNAKQTEHLSVVLYGSGKQIYLRMPLDGAVVVTVPRNGSRPHTSSGSRDGSSDVISLSRTSSGEEPAASCGSDRLPLTAVWWSRHGVVRYRIRWKGSR